MSVAVVWVDGSGLADHGPAGAAYVARIDDGDPVEGSVQIAAGTNQVAELVAAAYALEQLASFEYERVVVWSDSEYVVKGMNEWTANWIRRGWKTATGSDVKNQEHWRRLLAARDRHEAVEFRWCRGHAGTIENERADELAVVARRQAEREGRTDTAGRLRNVSDAFFAMAEAARDLPTLEVADTGQLHLLG